MYFISDKYIHSHNRSIHSFHNLMQLTVIHCISPGKEDVVHVCHGAQCGEDSDSGNRYTRRARGRSSALICVRQVYHTLCTVYCVVWCNTRPYFCSLRPYSSVLYRTVLHDTMMRLSRLGSVYFDLSALYLLGYKPYSSCALTCRVLSHLFIHACR